MIKEHVSDAGIFVIRDFFTPDECRHYIVFSEGAGYGDAPINAGSLGQVVRKDVRNNDRVMIDDADIARELWDRAKPFVPEAFGNWRAVGLNERLRFYRYDAGQRFYWHYDGSFERDSYEQSNLTFMVYLNDDFEGGETEFNLRTYGGVLDTDPLIRVVPRAGSALVFRHPILHQGAMVTKGRKYVLRSDVMYRYSASTEQAGAEA